MDAKTMYTLAKAARAADATENELVAAIKDGLLQARVRPDSGEYAIDPDDLARWVKRTRHADASRQVKKKKVLILGEDPSFAETVKLELGRNGRADVRFASWGADAIMMVNHYNADVYVVDLSPSKVTPDVVLSAVISRRAEDKGTLIATCAQPREAFEANPLLRGRLAGLAPEAFVPRAGSMRPLLVALFAALGLQTNTRVIKLQK